MFSTVYSILIGVFFRTGVTLLPVLLLLVIQLPTAVAHMFTPPETIEDHLMVAITENIYIIEGPQTLPNVKTRGFMNNPAAIIGKTGVIIVDPGSSAEIGRQLLKKVQERTEKPVIAVFNTHVHGDHWLGNQAIREAYPDVPIYAHEKMIERVKNGEGEDWLGLLNKMTENATARTKIIGPSVGLKGGEQLDIDGVKLQILHTGKAHTDHDIMINVIGEKSMFLGDVVANQRVPSSDVPRDANYKGQMVAIREVLKINSVNYIPGHGAVGGKEVPEASLAMLEKLYGLVKKYYEKGQSDFEMKDAIVRELEEYKHWHNFNELGRVISHIYLEIESDSF